MTTHDVRQYRSPGLWWRTLVFAVVFGGYCAVYGVLALVDAVDIGGPRSTGERIAIATIFVALAALAVVLWWRVGRVAIRVDDDEVVIDNPVRRHVLPRAVVLGMRTTSANGWVFIATSDEHRIPVFALSVGLRWTLRRRLAEVADETGIPLL